MLVERPVKSIFHRKLIKTSVLILDIPQNWVDYFHLRKGDNVELVLTDFGFTVKVKKEDATEESKVE